jgi:hypothetical protein
VNISYSLLEVEATRIYFDPEKRAGFYDRPSSPTAVQSCPAIRLWQNQSYLVRCPIDLRLRAKLIGGEYQIFIVEKDTSINKDKLKSLLSISPRSDWRSGNSPVLQISTPYVFRSEEPCLLLQRHPTEFDIQRLSWRLIEGCFQIDRWTRPLSWAVEWADTQRDIILRRGDPWFAVDFMIPPISSPKMRKMAVDQALREEILSTKDVASYIRGTFSLQKVKDGHQNT